MTLTIHCGIIQYIIAQYMGSIPADFLTKQNTDKTPYITAPPPGRSIFRIIGEAIYGTEYWVKVDKSTTPASVVDAHTPESEGGDPIGRLPKRLNESKQYPAKLFHMGMITINKFGKPSISKWMGVPVIDRADGKIKIWNITQPTIMRGLAESEDLLGPWEDYDIAVTRTSDSKKTSYSIQGLRAQPLTAADQKMVDETPIVMENMYITHEFPFGGDPFADKISDVLVGEATDNDIDPNDLPF